MTRPLDDIYRDHGNDINTMPADYAMHAMQGYSGLAIGTELLEQDDYDEIDPFRGDTQDAGAIAGIEACGFRVVEPRAGRA